VPSSPPSSSNLAPTSTSISMPHGGRGPPAATHRNTPQHTATPCNSSLSMPPEERGVPGCRPVATHRGGGGRAEGEERGVGEGDQKNWTEVSSEGSSIQSSRNRVFYTKNLAHTAPATATARSFLIYLCGWESASKNMREINTFLENWEVMPLLPVHLCVSFACLSG